MSKEENLPMNCGQIRLYIDNQGVMSGELWWKLAEDLPEECVEAMIESLHGLIKMIQTHPNDVMDLGRAVIEGDEEEIDYEMIDEEDFEDEEEEIDQFEFDLKDKIIPINPSNRKH